MAPVMLEAQFVCLRRESYLLNAYPTKSDMMEYGIADIGHDGMVASVVDH